jgi:hypothetical protein
MTQSIIQLIFMLFIFGLGVAIGLLWTERIELKRERAAQKHYHRTFPNNKW